MASSFESATPHFFKVILPQTLNQSKLAIPHKFVRKHGEALETEEVRLKVASGAEWKVGLTKNDEKIWFEKGWEEFVKFYSVEIGHFLTFRYEGNSCFHVVIFDKTASEIEYPLGCGGKVKKRERFSISEEATKFQSLTTNPSFMVTMGASYLHTGKSYLSIPQWFANAHMESPKEMSVEVSDGRVWKILCGERWPHGVKRVEMRGGWRDFARDNGLKKGDICVFELMETSELSFKATIFRSGCRG
ncbi:B3 domain-containing transcription factor VRN1-like [Cucurbita moschata]|uniref:B3 domain-containing transcription factor VRN1-like n=1 Tax=Cucurbita moschata TaxID=3662 RepID=A0A6J1EJA7_CUCMO|nr:B3 domain-containing transcription factor VRN1-like [Cucurbita moschata]